MKRIREQEEEPEEEEPEEEEQEDTETEHPVKALFQTTPLFDEAEDSEFFPEDDQEGEDGNYGLLTPAEEAAEDRKAATALFYKLLPKLFGEGVTPSEDSVFRHGMRYRNIEYRHETIERELAKDVVLATWLRGYFHLSGCFHGNGYWHRHDIAFMRFTEAYEAGSMRAAFALSLMHLKVKIPRPDRQRGMELLEEAAAAGHPVALNNLARFKRRDGDMDGAIPLYTAAADMGHYEAQFALSVRARFGQGMPQDFNRAFTIAQDAVNTSGFTNERLWTYFDTAVASGDYVDTMVPWGQWRPRMPWQLFTWFPHRVRLAIITTQFAMKRKRMAPYVANLITYFVATKNGW